MEKFGGETLNCVVLDTDALKMFVDSCLDSLTPGDLLKLVEEKKDNSFKFGDDSTIWSTKTVTIPATIGKDDVLIKTEVIQNDLLLLLSKDSVKKKLMLR